MTSNLQANRSGWAVMGLPVILLGLPLVLGLRALPWPSLRPLDPAAPWLLTIDRRVHAAAVAMPAPKLVFAGGSSLLFGLRPDALSRELGLPVAVYGLHGGLGLEVILDRVATVLRTGDCAVVTAELPLLRFRPEPLAIRQDFLVHRPPPSAPGAPAPLAARWSMNLARYRCAQLRDGWEWHFSAQLYRLIYGRKPLRPAPRAAGRPHSPYDLTAIRADGRLRFPRPEARPMGKWNISLAVPEIDPARIPRLPAARALRSFQATCRSRGVHLYIMPSPRLRVAAHDQAALRRLEEAWIAYAESLGIPAILRPGDTLLEPRYGFDTDYHLNDQGVRLLEPRLVEALRAHLPVAHPAAPGSGLAGDGDERHAAPGQEPIDKAP
jgi:hypothetical protein